MQWERIEGWGIPLASMAIAVLGVYAQHQRLVDAQAELQKAQAAATTASLARIDFTKEVGHVQIATASRQDEQARFLADLKQKAFENDVDLKSWAGTAPNAGTAPAEKANVPTGVVPVSSELTIDGSYDHVRNFIAALEPAQPLYIFSNVTWSRTPFGTELKLTITRYVAEGPSGAAQPRDVTGATQT